MATTKKTEPDVMQTSFELWKKTTQAYADLVLEGLNQSMSMGMSAWEQLDHIMVDALKKAQELSVQEQEMLLEVTEKFAEQLREGTERVSKIYTEKLEE
jgi:hypothetical protein